MCHFVYCGGVARTQVFTVSKLNRNEKNCLEIIVQKYKSNPIKLFNFVWKQKNVHFMIYDMEHLNQS